MKLIDKSKLLEELKKLKQNLSASPIVVIEDVESLVESLEVKDPYEQCVQYDSIKAGIKAHAETYSFNIESELFHQLTKEQQTLWRKEIEQACISGGEAGVELSNDERYRSEKQKTEEPVSNNLDDAAKSYGDEKEKKAGCGTEFTTSELIESFKAGSKWNEERLINKVCDWLSKNATYTHPRKGTEECIVNISRFKEAMIGEE